MRLRNLIHLFASLLACLCLVALAACSSDNETYPSLIADFVTAVGDSEGRVTIIITDDGQRFSLKNTITGIKPNTTARAICEYEFAEAGYVQVYKIAGIPLLPNVTGIESARMDPTGVAGVWYSGGYVNMHLLPKVYEGLHSWGFIEDSVRENANGGSTYFLSLCHLQRNDAEAFTGHAYMSISPDSISHDLSSTDSLHLTINTYNGHQTWKFAYRK